MRIDEVARSVSVLERHPWQRLFAAGACVNHFQSEWTCEQATESACLFKKVRGGILAPNALPRLILPPPARVSTGRRLEIGAACMP